MAFSDIIEKLNSHTYISVEEFEVSDMLYHEWFSRIYAHRVSFSIGRHTAHLPELYDLQ